MRFFNKPPVSETLPQKETPPNSTPLDTPPRGNSQNADNEISRVEPKGRVPAISIILGAVASIGGFMFGYESGQISGFLAMPDFIERFGENGSFSPVRQGTIVGLLA